MNYKYIEEPKMDPEPTKEQAHKAGLDCGDTTCQKCCPHDEYDHHVCLDCGLSVDLSEAIDRVMDYNRDNE